MGQRIITTLEDDLDGSEADETVSFGLDGVDYQIDLNVTNAANLRQALADYVAAGRRVGGRKRGGPAQGTGRPGADLRSDIREWARRHGHQVSERGRIARDIIDAYEAENGAKPRRRAR